MPENSHRTGYNGWKGSLHPAQDKEPDFPAKADIRSEVFSE